MGGGGLKIFRPHQSPAGTKSDGGGGTCKKNPTEAETTHLMQNLAIFCYFKHEIQLFKVLLSLKVVKFDTMYLNFSNVRRRTSAGGGGGDKPWSKNGDKCRWGGGIDNIFAGWGPPRKKTLGILTILHRLPKNEHVLFSTRINNTFLKNNVPYASYGKLSGWGAPCISGWISSS